MNSWDDAAAGWGRRREAWERFAAPISHRLIDLLEPQPGHRVLELAAGAGETGLLLAELIEPGGTLISTDGAEAMVEIARARGAELGVGNAEFKPMYGEWIDAPLASLDGVVCRFGLMLMDDPAAALRECRRVLRPGGRVAVAVWGPREANPLLALVGDVLLELGHAEPAVPGAPGPFALSDPQRLTGLLDDAGFALVQSESLALTQRAEDWRRWWQLHLDLALSTRPLLLGLEPDEAQRVEDLVRERLARYTEPDGSIALPALVILAAGEA
ncbi:MAG: hypothetical protein NVSMB51_02550 [Solirubrobacteraceae bacterium]